MNTDLFSSELTKRLFAHRPTKLHDDTAMKKWTGLVAAVCFTALVATAGNKEPQYQSRSLSDWAKQIDPHGVFIIATNGVPVPEPPEWTAIQSIGTNAIPTLLEWIRKKDPPDPEGKRTCFDTTQGDWAETCFGILGEVARPAIPALTRLALTLPDRERYERCVRSLAGIGPDALPSFQTILTKGREGVRWEALSYLPAFHSNAVVALPTAIKCLVGKNEYLGLKAAAELSRLDVPHGILVPALTNALATSPTQARLRVVRCLLWIGSPARDAVPALLAAMTDPSREMRDAASNAIWYIEPRALTNAPSRKE
jgi:hypothetical protein